MNFNGIIVIDKEQNMTSHDVVGRVRRILGTGKVGHTGTLDPMATGVLPICVGKATRIMEYLDMDFKTYRCSMLLGKETDSRDVWGGVLSYVPEAAVNEVREEEIREVFSSFRGSIADAEAGSPEDEDEPVAQCDSLVDRGAQILPVFADDAGGDAGDARLNQCCPTGGGRTVLLLSRGDAVGEDDEAGGDA